MQEGAPISAPRHLMQLEQRERSGDGSPNNSRSSQSMHTFSNRRRPTTTEIFSLPFSSSFLLLTTIIFAGFASSSSSSFVHAAAATTMASDSYREVEETASAWSEGSSRSVQDDKRVDLSTALTLPNFEERRLVSAGSDVVISSSDDGVTRVGGRRLMGSCPTFLYDDHADLVASDGWNLLSVNCTLGATTYVNGASGKRMKIKKDPSAVGAVVVDRQATSENPGQHFQVYSGAALEVEGLTLTGGYSSVRFLSFFSILFLIFSLFLITIKNMWTPRGLS